MSQIHEKLKAPEPPQNWHLKIDDGSTYGPYSTDALIDFAKQGRIAPGNEISPDKTKWMPAEDLSVLEMVWMINLEGQDDFGPLNIHALSDLIEDNTISDDSKITNRLTKKTVTIKEVADVIYGKTEPEQKSAEEQKPVEVKAEVVKPEAKADEEEKAEVKPIENPADANPAKKEEAKPEEKKEPKPELKPAQPVKVEAKPVQPIQAEKKPVTPVPAPAEAKPEAKKEPKPELKPAQPVKVAAKPVQPIQAEKKHEKPVPAQAEAKEAKPVAKENQKPHPNQTNQAKEERDDSQNFII